MSVTTAPHGTSKGAPKAQATSRSRAAKKRRWRDALVAYAFIAPWVIGFVIFTGGPIIASLALSFYRWKIIAPPQFVGFENFVKLFTNDEWFRISLSVTARYILIQVPIAQALALLLAVLLNQKVRLIGLWRTVFYLPAVVSGVAGSVLWAWMYHNELGIVNHFLVLIGLEPHNWLYSKELVLGALIVKSFWNVGVPMVIYLAALQGMPQSLYEAAEMDGAGEWTKFRSITLPMLSPAIFFNVVIAIVAGVQTFAEPYVMTKGGPDNATWFLGLYLYQTAFSFLQMGYASAMAWLMFLIIFALTIFQFGLARRWVYYEGEGR